MNPDGVQVAGWLASAFFVAGGLNQVLKLLDRAKEKPPPIETYATKAEVGLLRADVRGLEVKLDQRIEDIRRDMRQDRAAMDQADESRANEVHRRMNQLSQEFNDKFLALPHQVIATLKNTGAIR